MIPITVLALTGLFANVMAGTVSKTVTQKITNLKTEKSISHSVRKPNILLLVADDTAFGDIGAYGS